LLGALSALRALRRHARAPAPRREGQRRRGSPAVPGELRAAARSARGARGRSEWRLVQLKLGSLALVFFTTAAHGQLQSDWERANEEILRQSGERLVPPPPLDRSRLVEVKLPLTARTDFRYFVD